MRNINDYRMGEAQCYECGRIFNLLIEKQAEEWHYGHDCEVT